MFGVVPKPLWLRRIEPDDRNRIQLGMRCLLIEHDSGPVLIDTGAGNKEDPKFLDIYGIENAGANGRTMLEDGLAQIGVRSDEIPTVINTHLHFDHAGGNTYRDETGKIRPSFPRARYVVKRGEYDFATHTNERTAASYFPHNINPVVASGQFEFVVREKEIVKGVRVVSTPGHTPFHQSVLIESAGERALFLGARKKRRANRLLRAPKSVTVRELQHEEADGQAYRLTLRPSPTPRRAAGVQAELSRRYVPVERTRGLSRAGAFLCQSFLHQR